MASIYDKSSLVLIPSGTKTGKVYSQVPTNGDGDFTFTRASAATRVNADGNIEKETSNLLLQSNTFSNASWTKTNSSVTSGQSGYDGSSDAWQVDISSAFAQVEQVVSNSGVQTISVYAKAGTLNWVRLRVDHSGFSGTYFDLANGVLGSTASDIDSRIEDVGGGWYRCSLSVNNSITRVRIYPATANNDLTATSGNIYIQDAQVNQGLIAQEVITTTTSAVYGGITDNVPRLDYTDSSCPALLLEPQRTNLTPQSEYFDSGYTFSNVTTAANAAISPEGVSNAYEMTDDATNGNHRFIRQITGNTIGQSYTYSIFLKKGTMTNAFLNLFSGGTIANVSVDLENGTISAGSGTSQTIEDYGNDWYRCSITGVAGDTSVYIYLYMNSLGGYSGTGDNMYFYGAQLEAGSYATSYIPTYGSSVSRVAETCGGAGNASTFNSTEGVLYVETSALSGGSFRAISLSNNTNSNVVGLLYRLATNEIWMQVRSNGAETNIVVYSVNQLENNKIAIKYKENDFALWVNGVKEGTNDSGSTPVSLNTIKFGRGDGGENFYGNVKQVLTFNTALSDADLAALTTI